MNAVEHLFRNRRFHEVTLDEVAKEAQVGKGTIYRFFSDKDDLFFQTATSGFDEMCELLNRPDPQSTTFPERLDHACRRIMRFFARRRNLIRMMISEEGRVLDARGQTKTRWLERRAKLVTGLAAVLQDGVDHGHIRSDVSGSVLAAYLLSMLRTRSHELEGEPPEMTSLDLLLDIFWQGIRSADPASSPARKNQRKGSSVRARS